MDRYEILELADRIEDAMLQGYITPNEIAKHANCTRAQAKSCIEHVQKRWHRNQSHQSREAKREQAIFMSMNALKKTYKLYKSASDQDALGEANRAMGNIIRILSQVANLEGLNERTVRIGGDRDGVPIITETQSQVLVLEGLINNGYIDTNTLKQIESAILNRPASGTEIVSSLRQIDTQPDSTTTSQWDNQSDPT